MSTFVNATKVNDWTSTGSRLGSGWHRQTRTQPQTYSQSTVSLEHERSDRWKLRLSPKHRHGVPI